MRCERLRDRIGMLLDGELPTDERDEMSAHAADCPDCGRYRDELEQLRRQFPQARQTAPARLVQRVSSQLAVEASRMASNDDALPARFGGARLAGGWLMRDIRPYLRQAAAILVACAISITGTWWWANRTDASALLARDAMSAHVRALIQDNAIQVASLDTHTVKPWFAGRIEYSPEVKDLTAEGFQLIGGRLDYLEGRRVATLVYKRRLHQISVFICPSDEHPLPTYAARLDGYSVRGWTKGNMTYWAVSDIGEGELRELETLL